MGDVMHDGAPSVRGAVDMNSPGKAPDGIGADRRTRAWRQSCTGGGWRATAWPQPILAGNIKLDKGKSREKIDGMVALAMALGRAILTPITDDFDPFVL